MSFRPTFAEAKASFRPMKRSGIARKVKVAQNCALPEQNSDTGTESNRGLIASQGFLARKRGINKRGPGTKAWDAERARLKPKFKAVGITTCEIQYPGCWNDDYLGFAHDAKRRKQPDLGKVILGCNPCHDILENLGPERMKAEVDRIIAGRTHQP